MAAEANERLLVALRYIAQPTMGWSPQVGPPDEFALEGADERDVRLALATCIRMAREALSS